jgi:Zn-dependent protease
MIDVVLALMIIVSFLVAIVLHELAHALVATWLGDRSPATSERRTLSWRSHLDPVGTLLCVVLAFQSAAGMGWGRPIKPDPWKMKVGANTGVLLVALAGPIFSLIVGVLVAAVMRVLIPVLADSIGTLFILKFLTAFSSINIALAIFNLIPLYPLDGYQILYTLLPGRQAVQFSRSMDYGPFLILILFFLLPFLAQFARVDSFPLFRLAYYIQLGALWLGSLVAGYPLDTFYNFYMYGERIFG